MNQERNFIPDSKFQVPKTSIPYGNLDLVCPYDAVDPTSTYHPYFLQSLSGSRVYDASPRYISVLMRVPIYVLIHNCDSYILQASHGLIPSCKLQGLSLPTASLVNDYIEGVLQLHSFPKLLHWWRQYFAWAHVPSPCPRAWEVGAYDFMTPTQLIGADHVSAETNRNSQIENKTINQKSCTLKDSCLCCVSFVYWTLNILKMFPIQLKRLSTFYNI
mgnify:CR=1 FL=1